MSFRKFRLQPFEDSDPPVDPFESVYARQAKKTLARLKADSADGRLQSEDDRIRRDQALKRYVSDYNKAINFSRYGSLRQQPESISQKPNLESLVEALLNQQKANAEETASRDATYIESLRARAAIATPKTPSEPEEKVDRGGSADSPRPAGAQKRARKLGARAPAEPRPSPYTRSSAKLARADGRAFAGWTNYR